MKADDPDARDVDNRIVLLKASGSDGWLGPLGSATGTSPGAFTATFQRGFVSELSIATDRLSGPLTESLGQVLALHPVQSLDLRWADGPNADMAEIASAMEGWPQLRTLRRLAISRANTATDLELSDEALLHLGRNHYLSELRDLDLGGSRMTASGLAVLARGTLLDRLTRLSVYPVRHHAAEWFDGLIDLPCLDRLEALNIGGSCLGDSLAIRLLDRLAEGRITDLSIGENELTGNFAVELIYWPRLDKLRSLGLSENAIDADTLATLFWDGDLSDLEQLNLSLVAGRGYWAFGHGAWVANALSRLPKLSELALVGNNLTASDIRPLAQDGCLPRLRKLSLMLNPIGDDGVDVLTGAPWAIQIEDMGLMSCEITDRGAELLTRGPFDRLKMTFIRNGNQITDAGMNQLRERFGWVC